MIYSWAFPRRQPHGGFEALDVLGAQLDGLVKADANGEVYVMTQADGTIRKIIGARFE